MIKFFSKGLTSVSHLSYFYLLQKNMKHNLKYILVELPRQAHNGILQNTGHLLFFILPYETSYKINKKCITVWYHSCFHPHEYLNI